jgi:hypothetical protein
VTAALARFPRWWLPALVLSLLTPLRLQRAAALPVHAQQTATVTYAAGWNLIGGPDGTDVSGTDADLWQLAPDGSFESVPSDEPLTGGQGYWAFFSAGTQLSLPAADAAATEIDAPAAAWTLVGNPTTEPVSIGGVSAAYGYDPATGYSPVSLLAPGRGALVLPDDAGQVTLTPSANDIALLAPAPAPAANAFELGPAPAPTAASPDASIASVPPGGSVEVLKSGFGQAKAGGPIAVAALLQNAGEPVDQVPVSITVYDGSGSVLAAADTTARYFDSGETIGFVHRIAAAGSGSAARVAIVTGPGKPAGEAPPGSLSFGQTAIDTEHSGLEATTTLSSSFASDLTNVRVSAIAYDATGAIDGGGETIKRIVPAGGSVGLVVSLDVSGTPASVQFYAQLP